jgi:hypothetical protein
LTDELARRFEKWAIVPNTTDLSVRSGGSRMGRVFVDFLAANLFPLWKAKQTEQETAG